MNKKLFLLLFLAGCGGSDFGYVAEENELPFAVSYTEDELAPYRANCIDDNMPTIEADYQLCMSYVLTGTEQCAPARDRKIAILNREWNTIITELPGIIDECVADWRTYPEYCDAQTRLWIGNSADFCSVYVI